MHTLGIALLLLALISLPFALYAQVNPPVCSSAVSCLMSGNSGSSDPSSREAIALPTNSSGMVPVQVRTALTGGPLAHKWIQLGTGENAVTLGFGPANFPFIDAGQILFVDRSGLDLVSRWHFLPYHYTPAELPDSGVSVGEPIYLTPAQAENLISRERHHRFVVPYVPLFHDCNTYVCTLMVSAQGRSKLPCYLFFKGHW